MEQLDKQILEFLHAAQKHQVKMLMVGGIAVNFYGYKRHSADIDFWIKTSDDNLTKLKNALNELGIVTHEFPNEVKKQQQNISVKISPGMEIELITRFNPGKSFEEAYRDAEEIIVRGKRLLQWKVLSLNDLIVSKIRSKRAKDILDIHELKRINKIGGE